MPDTGRWWVDWRDRRGDGEEGRDSGQVLEEEAAGPVGGLDMGHEGRAQSETSPDSVYLAGADRKKQAGWEGGWVPGYVCR